MKTRNAVVFLGMSVAHGFCGLFVFKLLTAMGLTPAPESAVLVASAVSAMPATYFLSGGEV